MNSKHLVPKIDQWLQDAAAKLKAAEIPSANLDSELILAHVLGQDRTWIIAHRDETLSSAAKADELLEKRAARVPLAYLTGRKEFYGRDFFVNEHVLIPRPETEEMIEQLKLLHPQPGQQLIDVGTGSGAIAITAALESPDVHVEAVDISPAALQVAQHNATQLAATVDFYESDLLANAKSTYDFILANLPYVDQTWERSLETQFEPSLALFADGYGLDLIKKCIVQATEKLVTGGHILLEADPRQYDEIIAFAMIHGFHPVRLNGFTLTLKR